MCTAMVHLLAGLRIKENKEVYEGEVTELTPEETENQVCTIPICSALCSGFCPESRLEQPAQAMYTVTASN